MKSISLFKALIFFFLLSICTFQPSHATSKNPKVRLDIAIMSRPPLQKSITLELYPEKAPRTVKNFLAYVDSGFYNNTIFHRVINNFMIQGGGFEPDMTPKKQGLKPPIINEANNGLRNKIGSIAMARTNAPHSATAQFFINTKDNSFLNYKNQQQMGYAVFGQVIEGMELVMKISKVQTTTKGYYQDVPYDLVIIKKAVRLTPK